MDPATWTILAAGLALLAALAALAAFALVQRQGAVLHQLKLLGEQTRLGLDAATATQRTALAETERALARTVDESGARLRAEVGGTVDALRAQSGTDAAALRAEVATLREGNEQRLGTIAEQSAAAAAALRAEVGSLREGNEKSIAGMQAAMTAQLQAFAEQTTAAAATLRQDVSGMRAETQQALLALREGNEKKLAEIQGAVNEQLAKSVEQQMTASFARVTEQFAQVQKAMGEMQAVGAQIGDLKRLFGNVKTRGGWGETQVRAMLDDVLPPGAYEANWKPREGSDDAVEFAIIMPMRGSTRPRLPVDAKFPVEDYERLLTALDAADAEGERSARRALATRVRGEARKIAEKYILPPTTVEFAVMYLPTDGLYAEVARVDGLIDELGRVHRVLVMGPSLFPALLRTIHLGHVTLALEQKADEVRLLLGAARGEMQQMDKVLASLGKQATTFSNTIEKARVRTRAVDKKLRAVDALDPEAAALLIGAEEPVEDGETVEETAP
jgi:DNA recombination protein RmuC